MPKITPWPIEILTPAHPSFKPVGGIREGSPALSGLQMFDNLDGGPIWIASLLEIPIVCRTTILAAQAMEGLALSGVGLFSVPRYPRDRSPGASTGSSGVPHSDGTPFSDGTLYAGSSLGATMAVDQELFDAEVQVDLVTIQPLLTGEEFSIYYEDIGHRMHRILGIVSTTAGGYVLEITPPLRADTPAGTPLNFDRPECTMRMINARDFLPELLYNERTTATAQFEEAFW